MFSTITTGETKCYGSQGRLVRRTRGQSEGVAARLIIIQSQPTLCVCVCVSTDSRWRRPCAQTRGEWNLVIRASGFSCIAPREIPCLLVLGGGFVRGRPCCQSPPPKGPSLLLFAASKPRADLPRGDPQLQRVNKHGDVLRREEATLGRGYKHQ